MSCQTQEHVNVTLLSAAVAACRNSVGTLKFARLGVGEEDAVHGKAGEVADYHGGLLDLRTELPRVQHHLLNSRMTAQREVGRPLTATSGGASASMGG